MYLCQPSAHRVSYLDADRLLSLLMCELGYGSAAIDGPDGTEIEAHNCVFHNLAFADPAICEVDLSLLWSLSGRTVEHRCSMARGERSCRFAFKPEQSSA